MTPRLVRAYRQGLRSKAATLRIEKKWMVILSSKEPGLMCVAEGQA